MHPSLSHNTSLDAHTDAQMHKQIARMGQKQFASLATLRWAEA